MGYYAGDFYAGARGDPGFLGTLLGLGKAAIGLIPGVGPVASAALSAIPSGAARAGPGVLTRAATAGSHVLATGKGVIMKHPVLTGAAAAGTAALAGAAVARRGRAAAAGGRRRKHMNVCNPRALRRAIRRTHSFAKLAMKTIHLVHPKKKGSFGGFKKKRKK